MRINVTLCCSNTVHLLIGKYKFEEFNKNTQSVDVFFSSLMSSEEHSKLFQLVKILLFHPMAKPQWKRDLV